MFCEVDWAAFLIAMAIVELTPGPNMGWLTTLSARRGRKAGFLAIIGITLGLSVQLILAATGMATLIAGHDWLYETIRWAGVVFMLYLAWEAFSDTGESSPGSADGLEGLGRGFVANLLNPKALVFYIAIVSQFASCARAPLALQILLLGSLHILISVIVHTAIVVLGASIGDRIAAMRRSTGVRAAFALALVGIAIWIAFSTARAG
ncbi:MAG: LysE family translocator [Henriciella sp.]|uniref:LysE family translocator n=1 Tax=Henriciella sp. TaxID=1968823 RepID=UPI003C73C76B